VATKNGAVNASKSEVLLVNAPSGDYVYCVMTKNQQDQRWEDDNEGNVMLRKVARVLWEYFEPESSWKPSPETKNWAK
jgi:beta-lactamase class A